MEKLEIHLEHLVQKLEEISNSNRDELYLDKKIKKGKKLKKSTKEKNFF